MSITKIRNQFAACGLVAGGAIALALVLGLLMAPGAGRMGLQAEDMGPIAFKFNGIPIYQVTVDGTARRAQLSFTQQRRQMQQPEEMGPEDLLSTYSQALNSTMSAAAILHLAEKEKIKVDLDAVSDWLPQAVDEAVATQLQSVSANREIQLMFAQSQLEQLKKDKGEGSDEYKRALQQLNELKSMSDQQLYERMTGQTVEQSKTSLLEDLRAMLGDKSQLQTLQAEMATDKLRKKIEATIDTSDEAIRRSYDQYTFEQIYFESTKSPDPESKAKEVLTKIRGGMDFKAAMDEFTDMRPEDKEKKPSGQPPQVQDRLTIQQARTYTAILELKPGEISEVIRLPGAAAIYRVLKVEPNVPQDFDAVKANRAEQMKTTLVGAKLSDQIEQTKEGAQIEWVSEAYRSLDEFDQIIQPGGSRYNEFSGPQRQPSKFGALKQIFDQLAQVSDSPELVTCLRFACFSQMDALTTSGPERQQLDEERLQVYSDVSKFIFSSSFKFEYVSVLIAANLGDEALRQLLEIATNATFYDPKTFPNVEKVEKLIPMAAKVATPNSELVKQIQAELALAKQNAEEAKKLEEEQKKAEQQAQAPSETPKQN